MRRLPYSKLVTPENLLVAHSTRLPDGGVSARMVDLRDHHRQVAVITVDAHGLVRLEAPQQEHRLKQFAGRCRDADGRRLHRTIVWRTLAMEPLYARAVAEAKQTEGEQIAVRVLHFNGVVTLHQVDAPSPDMRIDPDVFPRAVASVEAWMDGQWVRVDPLPRRIQLPHTGVWVPRAFPVQVELEEVDFDGMERSWSMFVWIDGHPVGRAGRRGEYVTFTEYKPGALTVLDRFTRVCVGPQGESVASREELLEKLFAEQHIAGAVRKAVGQGDRLLKVDTPEGVELMQLPDHGVPGEPDYDQARADALRELPTDAVGADLWTEHGWAPLPLSD